MTRQRPVQCAGRPWCVAAGRAGVIAQPGSSGVFTGSYDIEAAYLSHDRGVYNRRSLSRLRRSFRITRSGHAVEAAGGLPGLRAERWINRAALANLLRPNQFPYQSKTGWVYTTSGDYKDAMRKAMKT